MNDINWAWFEAVTGCMDEGRDYVIDRGSFVGHQRRQLDYLALVVLRPETRPLAATYRGEAISTDEQVHRYYEDYLINPTVRTNEAYTYGSRIAPYLEHVAEMLRASPNTNQTTIEVGRPEDVYLDDPPCLRLLSWKAIDGRLQLSTFWRSWDLWSALPVNLGGLQLLNELMAEWSGLSPGPLVAYSDGAHVYDYCWDLFVQKAG